MIIGGKCKEQRWIIRGKNNLYIELTNIYYTDNIT